MMQGDIIIHWLDRTRAKHKQKGTVGCTTGNFAHCQ